MELNISPPFIAFARKAHPLSQSLPLLVHSWKEVTNLWLECAEKSDDDTLRVLFEYDLCSMFSLAYLLIGIQSFAEARPGHSLDTRSRLPAAHSETDIVFLEEAFVRVTYCASRFPHNSIQISAHTSGGG